jgi:hypothetical protein
LEEESMPVYRATIAGAKPILVRDDSAAKAMKQLVKLDPLSGDDLADALEKGETIHKAGDPIELAEKPAPEKKAD